MFWYQGAIYTSLITGINQGNPPKFPWCGIGKFAGFSVTSPSGFGVSWLFRIVNELSPEPTGADPVPLCGLEEPMDDVVPTIEREQYEDLRVLIPDLPQIFALWSELHEFAITKRGGEAILQPVSPQQFEHHMRRVIGRPSMAELFRCATLLAERKG
jgi:hypothetical protein